MLFSQDGEAILAGLSGMNNFSASIVLNQVTLQQFLDMPAWERILSFGGYIGEVPLVRIFFPTPGGFECRDSF